MWFYILILLLLICIAGRYSLNGYSLSNELRLKIPFFIISFVAIFRFNIGGDYPNYWNAIWPVITPEVYRWELIPRLMGLTAHYFKWPPLFFILIGIPSYYFFYKGIKENSTCVYESLMVFFCVFFLDTMLFARAILAASILFWASKFIFRKQLKSYIFVCFICFFIHKTSLIAIPLYFIYNYIDWKISLLGLVLFILLKELLLAKLGLLGLYSSYFLTLGSLKGGESLKFFYILIISFLIFISILKNNFNSQFKKLLSVLIVGILFPFVFGGHIGMRLAWFYLIYLCLAWPVAFKNVKVENRCLSLIFMYLFFILFLWISVKSHPSNSPYTPYQTIFFIDRNEVMNKRLILRRG